MTESLHRWRAKKAARKTVMLGSLMTGAIAARRALGPARVRAITYHRFGHASRDPYCVAPEAFEAQMRWLAERQLAVSLEDTLRFVRGEIQLPDGAVLVTMDDGFLSMLSIAAPVLARHGIPAVAFVTAGAIGDPLAGRDAGEPFMTWDQLAQLAACGVTIGSHGHSHRSMARLPSDEVRAEGRRSRELLEDRLGRPVTSFAYPYGMRADEDAATARTLGECGYTSIFISQHGPLTARSDPRRLPRIKVEAGEPLWMFELLCRGGMDAWQFADRLL